MKRGLLLTTWILSACFATGEVQASDQVSLEPWPRLDLGPAEGATQSVGKPADPSQDPAYPRIPWTEARNHYGEKVEIVATVVRTHDSGKATFLNFHEDWKGKFTAVIFASTSCDFSVKPADFFLGREVRIRGKVKEYKGGPEIIIQSLDQIACTDGTAISANPALDPAIAPRTAEPAEGVRVMSWNLENFFDVYDDPYSDDQRTNPSFMGPQRKQRISDVIHAINPDVLCVEEVENRSVLEQFNRSYLPDLGYEVVLFEGNDGRGIDVGVLTRLPVNSVTSYRHLKFEDAKGRPQQFRRDLLRVSIGGKLNADVYVVHFKSQHGGENSDIIRTSEAHAAASIIAAEMQRDRGYRAFICGDFNEVPEESTLQEFFDIGLVDAHAGTEKITYNQKPYLTRIDFTLFTPALEKDLSSATIVDGLEGMDLRCSSDHYPVVAELKAD
ncbi:MAG: endonuclease/exonuclease/phosphatase family protein [Planctomycetota bacterium]|jgi:exonuclease III